MDSGSLKNRFSALRKKLVFFGPGLLLAITAAGEAGIADAMEIGSHFGMSLVWVVIIALFFKYAFTTGIARYTLATGKTIFQALPDIPGPKNWAAYLTIAAYMVDAIAIGAMILFAGTFLDYLIPGSYVFFLICLLILLLSLLVLRTHIYHHFEKVMALIILILGVELLVVMIMNPITLTETFSGMLPSYPQGSEKEILAIIGAVGSGLMLMLYSVWLEKKIRVRNEDPSTPKDERFELGNQKMYRKYLNSVRLDILIGFILVAVITIGFMAVGYLGVLSSFVPHGTEISLDLLISMVLNLYHTVPYGNQIFFILVSVVFFGATVIGMDARASAITKVIKSIRENAGHPVKNTSLVYNISLLCFSLISAAIIIYNQPLATIATVSLICAIFFGIFGFMLMYLNRNLPEYAQGSRLWVLFIGIGSVLSIYFALVLEGTIITTGLNLLKTIVLVLAVLLIFIRSKMFSRLVDGTATLADKFWLIAIFGAISVIGTVWGIPASDGSYIINFRDLGPIIAGVIGGPLVGAIVGLIGGLYRLSLGDVSALTCCIATVAAGLIAGFFIRYKKGRFTFRSAVIIAIMVELFHLLFIYPTVQMLTNGMDALTILEVIRSTVFPMTLVMILACLCFAFFVRKVERFELPIRPFSFTRLKVEVRELIQVVGKHDNDAEEKEVKQ